MKNKISITTFGIRTTLAAALSLVGLLLSHEPAFPQERSPIEGPRIITEPGSYYLAHTLLGAPAAPVIVIQASDVKLDLNGMSVDGGSGALNSRSTYGIIVNGAYTNVSVFNGEVRNCLAGVFAANAVKSRFENLRVANNSRGGLQVGSENVVNNCVVEGNAWGITAQEGSSITACTANANQFNGIAVASGCRVQDNKSSRNGGRGIYITGDRNRIDSNMVFANGLKGIEVVPSAVANVVVRNQAAKNGQGATDNYVIAGHNRYGKILGMADGEIVYGTGWENFGE